MDDYALSRVAEDVGETSHDRVKAILEGLINSSFLNLAIDEDDLAVNYDRFAQRIWQRYDQAVGDISRPRVGLPKLSKLKEDILNQLLDPESGLEPQIANQLRAKLRLPAAAPLSATSTNQPPAGPASTNKVSTNPAPKKP